MKITLNESGICLPDAKIVEFINDKMIRQEDIHISNELILCGIRAWLVVRPIDKRPKIEWFIYGKQVYFDDDLRGGKGVWDHPLMGLLDDFLSKILW